MENFCPDFQVTLNCCSQTYRYHNNVPRMLSVAKNMMLHGFQFALGLVETFIARFRSSKKVDVEANGGDTEDLQVTLNFSFRYRVKNLLN